MTTQQSTGSFKISGATIHILGKEYRKKLAEGSCTIDDQGSDTILKIKSFAKNIVNVRFGRIKYQNSISYFFNEADLQNKIHVISVSSIQNSQSDLKNFQALLKAKAEVTNLTSVTQTNTEIIEKLQTAYSKWESVEVQNRGSKVSRQIGAVFGAISGLMTKPLEAVGQKADDQKQLVYRDSVKQETKTKWQNVKVKAGNLNDSLTKSLKPVSDGAKNVTDSLGKSFESSNNSVIKAIRNFGIQTKNALNQGYSDAIGQKKTKEYAVSQMNLQEVSKYQ